MMVDCSVGCTFTGWQHHAEGYGDTGAAYTTSTVGSWVNVAANTISSLRMEGPCDLTVANGADGQDVLEPVYEGGGTWSCGQDPDGNSVSNCLPTGNDNIDSVMLTCEGEVVSPPVTTAV